MLQRVACLDWRMIQTLNHSDILKITKKTNYFVPYQEGKEKKQQKPPELVLKGTVVHKSL